MRFLCSLMLAVLTGCASTTAVPSPELERFLRSAEALGFDGQVLVEKDGRVLLDGAYGLADRARGIAVERDTRFGIASQSKSVTAAAILLLESRGTLRVEDPITRFFDEVPADKRDITLHQLLTHSSGLPPGDVINDFQDIAPAELVKLVFAQPRTNAGKWQYSNAGYNLLAAVIERASKKPYAMFLREEIFRPLGMRHSGVIGVDRPAKGAVAYRGLVAQGSVSDWPRNWRTWGGGDVFSTASDLHRFARALRGTDFLPGAQRAKLFGRHVAMPEGEEHYAYGWFVAPEVVEHGGDTEKGFHCAFRIYGDGVTLILVGNRTEVNGPWQRWLVQDEIAAIARAKESKPLPVVRSGGGPADGTYRSADGGALVVRRHGKQLVLEARSQPAALSLWGAAADAEKLARAVAKTTTLLETAKTDPRAAFQGALTAAAEEHTDAYLDEWGSLVRDQGEYRGFSVSGAVPRGAAARVFAELQFARASVPMTFIFQDRGDGRLAGSRPGEGPPLARVFASESPSRFIAVHLASRERVVLDLRSGDGSDGFVLGGAEYRREPR